MCHVLLLSAAIVQEKGWFATGAPICSQSEYTPLGLCPLFILYFAKSPSLSHKFYFILPFSPILTYIHISFHLCSMFFVPLSLSLSLCLLLCHHPLFLIPQRLNPTLSLLQSICQVSLSIFPWLIVLFFCLPLSSTLSVCWFLFFPLHKTHLFPLLYLSHPPLPFLCVPDSEPVGTKGHGGLTLIDVSDRGEEEEVREGWL